MATEKRRASSMDQQTLNAVFFEKDYIDDVIADIALNTTLKNVKVSDNPSGQGQVINLERSGLSVHIAELMLKGDRYLAMFDPHSTDGYIGDTLEEIKSVSQGLRELLLKYASKEVREYMEKTIPES
ncbi:hypothetical protein KY343_03950 [Candidatus Woesearchaeota archaeon]|nr:hypothetical protein [Candidatus Woesearchaeota archaeon]